MSTASDFIIKGLEVLPSEDLMKIKKFLQIPTSENSSPIHQNKQSFELLPQHQTDALVRKTVFKELKIRTVPKPQVIVG